MTFSMMRATDDDSTSVAARAMAQCILERRRWCKKAVERIQFLEGGMVRREVSLHIFETETLPLWSTGQVIIPLTATLKKPKPLRDLRVFDSAGDPMPILSSKDARKKLEEAYEILNISPDGQGRTVDQDALDKARRLSDFIKKYQVPMALAPQSMAGIAGVITYSYCADLKPPTKPWERVCDVVASILAGFGVSPYIVDIPLMDVRQVGTYHLEVPTPHGLITKLLEIPPGQGSTATAENSQDDKDWQDDKESPIPHVRAGYLAGDDGGFDYRGRLALMADLLGTLPLTVLIGSLLSLAVFCGLHWLPTGGHARVGQSLAAWKESGRVSGGTSIMLFGAAALLALQGRQGENIYTRKIAAPLRVYAFVLAAVLGVAGTSLIGDMKDEWFATYLWIATAVAVIPWLFVSARFLMKMLPWVWVYVAVTIVLTAITLMVVNSETRVFLSFLTAVTSTLLILLLPVCVLGRRRSIFQSKSKFRYRLTIQDVETGRFPSMPVEDSSRLRPPLPREGGVDGG